MANGNFLKVVSIDVFQIISCSVFCGNVHAFYDTSAIEEGTNYIHNYILAFPTMCVEVCVKGNIIYLSSCISAIGCEDVFRIDIGVEGNISTRRDRIRPFNDNNIIVHPTNSKTAIQANVNVDGIEVSDVHFQAVDIYFWKIRGLIEGFRYLSPDIHVDDISVFNVCL